MEQPALVISKDIVTELKRLASLASKDDIAFEQARIKYEKSGQTLVSSSSALAVALYDFSLRYASQPDLVDAKLHELGIQFKSTSSVYVKIARLAFDDVRDENGEVSRTRVSRYAGIIEAAHASGLTTEQFTKTVERGVTQAMRRFNSATKQVETDAIENGRALASELVGKQTFAIDHFPLPDNAAEGDDVELIARVEGGKLVVYGMLPSSPSNVRGLLSKLGAPVAEDGVQIGRLIPELLRAIKLVTGTKDTACSATYSINGEYVQFVVFGANATAVFMAPMDYNIFGTEPIVLPVADWRRIFNTLNPIRKHIASTTVNGLNWLINLDEDAVPDVDVWFEQNAKAKMIGVGKGSTLEIEIEAKEAEQLYLESSEWGKAAHFNPESFAVFSDFKSSKKTINLQLQADVLILGFSDKPLKGQLNLDRKTFAAAQPATKKMLRLSPELVMDQIDGYLRFSCMYDKAYQLSLIVSTV